MRSGGGYSRNRREPQWLCSGVMAQLICTAGLFGQLHGDLVHEDLCAIVPGYIIFALIDTGY